MRFQDKGVQSILSHKDICPLGVMNSEEWVLRKLQGVGLGQNYDTSQTPSRTRISNLILVLGHPIVSPFDRSPFDSFWSFIDSTVCTAQSGLEPFLSALQAKSNDHRIHFIMLNFLSTTIPPVTIRRFPRSPVWAPAKTLPRLHGFLQPSGYELCHRHWRCYRAVSGDPANQFRMVCCGGCDLAIRRISEDSSCFDTELPKAQRRR